MPALATIARAWRPALAGLLCLVLPLGLWFDGRVHTSQLRWLATAVLGGLLAITLRNAGLALLLAWAAIWTLFLRFLAVYGQAPVGVYQAAQAAFDCMVAGAVVLHLLPALFRGRSAWFLNLLRSLALLLAAWAVLGLLGLDPLLRPSAAGAGLPMGHNGGLVESPIVLAGIIAAAVPLFFSFTWPWAIAGAGLLFVGGHQHSWSATLALTVGLAAWLTALFHRSWGGFKVISFWLVCLLALAALAVGCILWHGGPGADQRLMLWGQALANSTAIGWGPGSWPLTLGRVLGHQSPYSLYVLVLWEYGWVGLACLLLALWRALTAAWPRPWLFGAVAALATASAGTFIWEQPVAALWGLLLLALVEVDHEPV